MRVADATGRRFEVTEPVCRVVSLVPSLTEALFTFGAGDQVVGITRYCLEPPEGVATKPKVGGTKNPDVAAILALEPDLVVASAEENRQEDIGALLAAGVPVLVTLPVTVRGAIELLWQLAQLTGTLERAQPMLQRLLLDLARVHAEALGRAAVPTFCPIWRRPYMTIGPDTYMHDLLATVGARNIFADAHLRYPTVELGEVEARNPHLVLLPDEPYPFAEKHLAEVRQALADTVAVRAGQVHLVDGKLLSWYGPRIGDALTALGSLVREGREAAGRARVARADAETESGRP